MKKIAYQVPEVKIKALFMEQLMAASPNGVTGTVDDGDEDGIGWGGKGSSDDDPDAKLYEGTSVWDD